MPDQVEPNRSWPKDLEIVDPHHHFWDLEQNSYPWLQQEPPPTLVCGDIGPIRYTYLPRHLKSDFAGLPVTKTVHIETGWNPDDIVGETVWLEGQAETAGLPSAIIAHVSLENDNAAELLDAHMEASDRLRGIRQILNWHSDDVLSFGAPRDLMQSSSWRSGFAALADRNLSFDLQIYPHQFDDAIELRKAIPEVRLIINHGGMPVDRTPEGLQLWRSGLRKLAELDDVWIKISGLGMVDHHWTTDSIAPIVGDILEIFGTGKTMFASNFPVDSLYSSYATVWFAFLDLTQRLSPQERQALFSRNAEKAYRI
ncbi:amidohydrolase family protein [Hoeflea sp. CAU 1731]